MGAEPKPKWLMSASPNVTKVHIYHIGFSHDAYDVFRDINHIRRANAEAVLSERFQNSRKDFAEALSVDPAFIGRFLNPDAAQPRNIGDPLARKIELAGGKPINWLDHDHENSDPVFSALADRFRNSPADTQALIQLALDDPNTPLPESMRPSLKTMIEGVRMALRQHIQQ